MSFDVTTASTDYLTKNSYPVGFNSVYTTMFWWNFEGSTGSYQLLWYGWSADDAAYDGVGIDSGDTLLRGECYGGATETTSTGGSLASGNWYHIAVVRESATSLKFYLDGALTITLTDNVGSRAAQTKEELLATHVGFGSSGKAEAFKQWNRALTANEIAVERKTTLPVNRLGLYCYHPMIASTAAEAVKDWSGNARNFTIVGTGAVSTNQRRVLTLNK